MEREQEKAQLVEQQGVSEHEHKEPTRAGKEDKEPVETGDSPAIEAATQEA